MASAGHGSGGSAYQMLLVYTEEPQPCRAEVLLCQGGREQEVLPRSRSVVKLQKLVGIHFLNQLTAIDNT
ncbi:hypothetical protein HNQ59_002908 [Chitinivorax tropicus]|uniref:Uncharacterized protein n=1 Tax=Chitinivorax tropicus TaxID=714531 RepID=A0A840MT90_9PROT|nr:hypothetical protein [Chitinivorax tropicus]